MPGEVDSLWMAMADIYGHRWVSSFGADPTTGAGSTWATGLAGVTARQLADGINACITSSDPWPPTLPEFRAMCLGVPSLAFVRDDITRAPQHRNRFTLLVWSYVDAYRIKLVSADQADRQLRDAYELAREHVMRGGALPKVVAAIEQDEPKPPARTPEVAEAALATIAAELAAARQRATAEPAPVALYNKTEVEADLQAHYADRKAAAAGPDL